MFHKTNSLPKSFLFRSCLASSTVQNDPIMESSLLGMVKRFLGNIEVLNIQVLDFRMNALYPKCINRNIGILPLLFSALLSQKIHVVEILIPIILLGKFMEFHNGNPYSLIAYSQQSSTVLFDTASTRLTRLQISDIIISVNTAKQSIILGYIYKKVRIESKSNDLILTFRSWC